MTRNLISMIKFVLMINSRASSQKLCDQMFHMNHLVAFKEPMQVYNDLLFHSWIRTMAPASDHILLPASTIIKICLLILVFTSEFSTSYSFHFQFISKFDGRSFMWTRYSHSLRVFVDTFTHQLILLCTSIK